MVGLEDLKTLNILHKEFPRTLPEQRKRWWQKRERYNSIIGEHWEQVMDKEEERKKARGVLLYLEEKNEKLDKKVANFDNFPEKMREVLDKYKDVFDSRLRKSMKVKPVLLNVRKGSKPSSCLTSQPSPAQYWSTSKKRVANLLKLNIIVYTGDQRSEWCAQAHLVEKAVGVLLAPRLLVDYTSLNSCLIRDQAQVFPTGEEMRQQLGKECKVWATSDALAVYYQREVYKMVNDLLIGGKDYT